VFHHVASYYLYFRCVIFQHVIRRVRKIAIATISSSCLYVRPSIRLSFWNDSPPIGRISMKFCSLSIFRNVEKIQYYLKSANNNGYITWSLYTCLMVYRTALFWMRSFNNCRGNQNAHFVFSKFIFRKSCRDNMKKYCRSEQATRTHARTRAPVWRMRISCWVPKRYTCTLIHCCSGYKNAPQCYVICIIACFASFIIFPCMRQVFVLEGPGWPKFLKGGRRNPPQIIVLLWKITVTPVMK
jgi:hypothetical protein